MLATNVIQPHVWGKGIFVVVYCYYSYVSRGNFLLRGYGDTESSVNDGQTISLFWGWFHLSSVWGIHCFIELVVRELHIEKCGTTISRNRLQCIVEGVVMFFS